MADYLRTFHSLNSRYDRFLKGDNDILTDIEKKGFDIFMSKANCVSCHSGINFSNNTFQNNGLYPIYPDQGRSVITQIDGDIGRFMVQSLRNIELTAPYMHDGSLHTLEEVIDHYSTGIQAHENLDFELKSFDGTNTPKRFNFSPEEKEALVAYFHTLTDEELLEDIRFSNPFK